MVPTAESTAPLVSVLIPVHNGENYIAQAIASALSQGVQPLQLLVIDDASTDRTADIVKSFGSSVEYELLKKQSCHLAVMNIGLRRVTGKYVCVLHHDDFMLPGKLRRAIAVMEADPKVGLTYSALWFVGPSGEPLAKFRSRVRRGAYVVDGDVELKYVTVQNHLHFGNAVLRRSALESIEPFDEQLTLCGEWLVWMRLLRRYRVGYTPDALFCYRIHPVSFSFTGTRDTMLLERQAMAVIDRFFSEPGLSPEVAARHDLSLAGLNINLGLLRLFRREWGHGARTLATALTQAGPLGLPDLLRSTAIGPRLLSRARMLAGNRVAGPPVSGRFADSTSVEELRCPACGGMSGYPVRTALRPGAPVNQLRCIACGARWAADPPHVRRHLRS